MEWDSVFLLQLTEYNFPDNIYGKFQCDKWYLKDKYKNTEALIKSQIDVIVNGRLTENHYKQTKIDLINDYLKFSGWVLNKDLILGVFYLVNTFEDNRIRIDRETSLVLFTSEDDYEDEKERD